MVMKCFIVMFHKPKNQVSLIDEWGLGFAINFGAILVMKRLGEYFHRFTRRGAVPGGDDAAGGFYPEGQGEARDLVGGETAGGHVWQDGGVEA